MTVIVSFILPGKGFGSSVEGVGRVRKAEALAIGGTVITSATAETGEYAIIGNAETSMIKVAKGSAPDPDATSETSTTSAGIPVPSSCVSSPILLAAGDKIKISAVS